MTGTASTATRPMSPPDVAVAGGNFSGTLSVVRKLFLGRRYEATVQDIQTALASSRRTAERVYAGQSVSCETTLAILTAATIGGPVLEEALRRVPLERRAHIAKELRESADLIRMEAEHETLARELAERRAGR
jgi:hypothetical protein